MVVSGDGKNAFMVLSSFFVRIVCLVFWGLELAEEGWITSPSFAPPRLRRQPPALPDRYSTAVLPLIMTK